MTNVPIVSVTVSEDRAHVRRQTTLHAPKGQTLSLAVEISPLVVDKTAQVRCVGASVRASNITRKWRDQLTQKPKDAIVKEIEVGDRTLESLDRLAKAAVARSHQLATFASERVRLATHDIAWSRFDAGALCKELAEIAVLEESTAHEGIDLQAQHTELAERLKELRLHETKPADSVQYALTELTIELDVQSDDGAVDVTIDYVVPGAAFRPQHTAHWHAEGEARVVFSTDACVWQNTGEDWPNVQLAFSTARPSLGTSPPTLVDDILSVQRKSDTVVVAARETEVMDVGEGAAVVASELPGLDDGGIAREWVVKTPITIESDGRPHRVPIASFESKAKSARVLFPELSPAVIFKVSFDNASKEPVLAGPVDLIARGGWVGKTQIGFVAEGEKVSLGFGPDPAIRCTRTIDVRDEDPSFWSGWSVRTHHAEIKISNVSSDSIALECTERVPVSEIDKVKIEVDAKETTDAQQPDDDGFVTWPVTLKPRGRQTLRLRYLVKKSGGVVSG